jgi:hypothetical protein
MSVKEVAEAFWSAAGGAVDRDAVSPLSNPTLGAYEEIAPGILFFLGFGNVAAFGPLGLLVPHSLVFPC